MAKITSGNARAAKGHNGWFFGQFMDKKTGTYSTDVELKWGVFAKGEHKHVATANRTAKSMSILIRGHVVFTFPKKKVVLKNEGDYVFWENNVLHSTKILKDSVVLTVRWPSVPNDVYTK